MLLKREEQQPSEQLQNFNAACWYVRADDNKSHKKNKAGPCRRWGHSSEVLDNKLVVYGGTGYTTNPRHWENVYQLDLDNWDWTKLEPTNKAPASRDSHSGVIYQRKLYVFGGSGGSDSKNDMLEYDLVTNQWRKLEVRGNTPSPREGHSACLFDGRYMVIYGGWNGEETFNDCYLFDIPQRNWISITKKIGNEPSPRESQSCCMLRNSMYLFGGQGNNIQREGQNLDNFCNDLHRLQIIFEGNQVIAAWEKVEIPGQKPAKRSSHAACVYQDRYLVVIGGEGYPPGFDEENKASEYRRQHQDGEDGDKEYPCFPKNDVWFFDVETNQWFEIKGKNEKEFVPRFAHSCHNFRNNILVFGGLQDYHNSTNDICVLSLDGANPFGPNSGLLPKGAVRERDSFNQDAESEQSYGSEQRPDRRTSAPEKFDRFNRMEKTESTAEKREEIIEKSEDLNGSRMMEESNHLLNSRAKKPVPDNNNNKFNAITPTHHHHGGHPEPKPEPHPAPFPVKTGPLVSLSFLNALSSIMSWPLASFGLLLDNALITKASEFRMNYLSKVIHDQRPKSIQEEKVGDAPEHKESLVYLQFEDNGLGWKHDDFIRVIMNYDMDWSEERKPEESVASAEYQESIDPNLNFDKMRKRLNEYAFNLKVAGLRLGKSLIYISRHEDELSVGFISIDKRFNPNIHRNHVFYYSVRKSTGEYLTSNALKHKAIIFNALKGLFSEEDLFRDMEKVSNKIIVLELNPAVIQRAGHGKGQNRELVFKHSADGKPDIVVRSLDMNIQSFYKHASLSFIELSLRTYFNYFLLDPTKTHLKVFLNDSQIEFINNKDRIQKLAAGNSANTPVNEKDLFDGILINPVAHGAGGDKIQEEQPSGGESVAKKADLNQGVLIYSQNRLIRRLENPKLGNLDFLSFKSQALQGEQRPIFETEGFIELKGHFKPNIFKTEIENPYYSNYLHSIIRSYTSKLNQANGKRRNDNAEEGAENTEKKIKV